MIDIGDNMGITKVTRNYQITLPQDVRQAEQIQVGDRLIITTRGNEIVLRKLDEDIIEKCFGAWKTKGSGVAYVRRLRKEAERREKRLGL